MLLRTFFTALPFFAFSMTPAVSQMLGCDTCILMTGQDENGNYYMGADMSGVPAPTALNIPLGNTLVSKSATDITISQDIKGAGSFTQSGEGLLTLTGTNTYSGGTTINSGKLAVTSDQNLGAANGTITFGGGTLITNVGITSNRNMIVGDGGGTIDAMQKNNLLTGTISNNADGDMQPFILNGGGQTIFTGNHTYNGATIVDHGFLKLGNGGNTGSVAGTIALWNNAELQFDRNDNIEVSNKIVGTGTVRKMGTNTLTLLGDIEVVGTTFIDGGKLYIGNNDKQGSIKNNIDIAKGGELLFNRSDDKKFDGVISGEGKVTQYGSGSTTLTNTHTYTGNTSVQAGKLYVNGSIAKSAMTIVDNGATLGGTGTVGNAINNGIVNPGSGVGTIGALTFNGNFVNNGILSIDVNAKEADTINVTNRATLNGKVNLIGTGGGFTSGQRFKLVDTTVAGNLDSARFSDVTYSGFSGFRPVLSYENGDVYVTLTAVELPPVFLTSKLPLSAGLNTMNAAKSLDKAVTTGYNPAIFGKLQDMSGTALVKAIDQFSGEIANTSKQVGLELGNQFMRAMLDPFTSRECISDCGQNKAREMAPARPTVSMPVPKAQGNWMAWTTASASQKTIDGDAQLASHATKITPVSLATGLEYRYNDRSTVGFALSGGNASFSLSDNLGSGSNNAAMLGVYGKFSSGDYGLSAAAFTGFQDTEYKRSVLTENLSGKANGMSFGGRIEASRKIDMGAVTLSPYVAMQAQTFRLNGYSEKAADGGGATAALSYGAQSSNSVRSEIGFGVEYAASLRQRLNFRVAYAHEYADGVSTKAAFIGAQNAPFTTYGATGYKDSMIVKAGTDYALTNAAKLSGNLTGEFSGASRSIAADVAVKWVW
jgi:fibronectin-binding autotransporter adhesin